jgi:hypothetical protein
MPTICKDPPMGSIERFLRQRFSPRQILTPASGAPERTVGPPTSSNGASSFHLFWTIPPVPLSEVRATITITEAPRTPHLYFWALQASFADSSDRGLGAGHLGLQHHPDYDRGGALNWGGYHDGGGELSGSTSLLGSAVGNPNTSNFVWVPGRAYRYRIHRSPERGWRGSITDLGSGEETMARDLWIEADHLSHPMVWSEVFAPCDAPAVEVVWTDLHGLDRENRRIDPVDFVTNYQRVADGGCSNTSIHVDGTALIQRTSTARTTPSQTRIRPPS